MPFKYILSLKTHIKLMFLVVEPLGEVKPPEPLTNKFFSHQRKNGEIKNIELQFRWGGGYPDLQPLNHLVFCSNFPEYVTYMHCVEYVLGLTKNTCKQPGASLNPASNQYQARLCFNIFYLPTYSLYYGYIHIWIY